MWHLHMAEQGGEWSEIGGFETLSAAAKRIIQLEDYPVRGVFFRMLVEADYGNDAEFFSHLEHRGSHTGRFYSVKRVQQ